MGLDYRRAVFHRGQPAPLDVLHSTLATSDLLAFGPLLILASTFAGPLPAAIRASLRYGGAFVMVGAFARLNAEKANRLATQGESFLRRSFER